MINRQSLCYAKVSLGMMRNKDVVNDKIERNCVEENVKWCKEYIFLYLKKNVMEKK